MYSLVLIYLYIRRIFGELFTRFFPNRSHILCFGNLRLFYREIGRFVRLLYCIFIYESPFGTLNVIGSPLNFHNPFVFYEVLNMNRFGS
jgi:hypothetical protein